MSISHFEQEAAHQQFSISEQDEFTAAKLFDGTFSTAITDVLKGVNRQAQSDFELGPDGTILLGTVPVDQNSISKGISGAVQSIGSALKNAMHPPLQALEDPNAMDKPSPEDAPGDTKEATPATKNELKAYDIKREAPVKPAEAPAPRPGSAGATGEVGAAIADAVEAGSAVKGALAQATEALHANTISGSLLQNLLRQNSSGGIISGLKEVLPGQQK